MMVEEIRSHRPSEITIGGRSVMLSKIPSVEGRQIYSRVVKETRDSGDIGLTMLSEELESELLKHAAVKDDDGNWVVIDSDAVKNSFFPDVENLIEVDVKMVDYNFGFLGNGRLREILGLPKISQ